jgi:hypothetical protein
VSEVIDRSEIQFEAEQFWEDRSQFGEARVLWIDLVWNSWRIEQGHSMDEKELHLFFRGQYRYTVRSIRKAKDYILDCMEE